MSLVFLFIFFSIRLTILFVFNCLCVLDHNVYKLLLFGVYKPFLILQIFFLFLVLLKFLELKKYFFLNQKKIN